MNEKNTKKLFNKFKAFLKKKELKNGFECGDGWFQILFDMCTKLAEVGPPEFKVTRVFEKFDELKVFTTGGVNGTRFVIESAQELASETCSGCGNLKELQQCEKCKEKDDGSSTYVPDIAAAIALPTAAPVQTNLTLSGTPSDYYFKMDNDPNSVPPDFFLITPKVHWDAHKTLYDGDMQSIRTVLGNNNFYEMEESMFEYQGLASADRKSVV
jgi:hypothetical protein